MARENEAHFPFYFLFFLKIPFLFYFIFEAVISSGDAYSKDNISKRVKKGKREVIFNRKTRRDKTTWVW